MGHLGCGWGGVGWGGGKNVHVNLNTHGLYGVHLGVGWGGGGVGVVTLMSTWKYVMLRCGIFSSCYSFAHKNISTCVYALCLVFSNFDLNLLISTAALELQLSKRCPTWPHPRHVRGIRSSTLSMLHSCNQSKVCSTWISKSLFQWFKLSMCRSMIQPRYPRCQKHLGKPWKNNIQMPAEHSTQLNIRNPKLRRHRNHCGFLCACSLGKRDQPLVRLLMIWYTLSDLTLAAEGHGFLCGHLAISCTCGTQHDSKLCNYFIRFYK